MTTETMQQQEKNIAQMLLTPTGKESLRAAMHLDTQENFNSFYGPVLDDIFDRAQKKYTPEKFNQFVNNFISLL
jgi:hypothetical protein